MGATVVDTANNWEIMDVDDGDLDVVDTDATSQSGSPARKQRRVVDSSASESEGGSDDESDDDSSFSDDSDITAQIVSAREQYLESGAYFRN